MKNSEMSVIRIIRCELIETPKAYGFKKATGVSGMPAGVLWIAKSMCTLKVVAGNDPINDEMRITAPSWIIQKGLVGKVCLAEGDIYRPDEIDTDEDDYPSEGNPFGSSDYGEPSESDDPKDELWYNDSSRRLPNIGR